jgi:hypothetical protein
MLLDLAITSVATTTLNWAGQYSMDQTDPADDREFIYALNEELLPTLNYRWTSVSAWSTVNFFFDSFP